MIPDIQQHMQHAWWVAKQSDDPSTQLGALAVLRSGAGVIQGFNHLPLGTEPEVWHSREKKYRVVIHAEEAVVINAAREGASLEGAVLVCPWACCERCAGFLIGAGIKALVYDNAAWDRCPLRWVVSVQAGHEALRRAGVIVHGIDLELPKPQTLFDGVLW